MSRYIDAWEVNEVLGKAYNERAESGFIPENAVQKLIAIGINYARNLIMDKVPAADVKPIVRGEWVDNGISDSVLAKCSVCGIVWGAVTFDFCPGCGADMRGEKK